MSLRRYTEGMHVITDRLLVGNIDDARQIPPTVGAVLLVASEFDVSPPAWVEYAKIPLTEFSRADTVSVARAVEWIECRIRTNRVMVCCRAGMGRSISIVLAYLCCVEGMEYGAAVKVVMARRPGACPLPDLEHVIQALQEFRGRKAGSPNTPRTNEPPGTNSPA